MPIVESVKSFRESPTRSFGNWRYRLQEQWRRHTSSINLNPVLVLGNQKSGTSAIAGLLGEATGLSYTIDVLHLYKGLEDRLLNKQSSLDELLDKGRYYFSRDIVKDPGLTFLYDDLSQQFPNAKKVFVLRDPRHNIRSILNRLNLPGHLDDLSNREWRTIARDSPAWYSVLEGSSAGHKGCNYIETLALRSLKTFQMYQQHSIELIPVRYELFKQDKVAVINNLASQLSLPVVQNIDNLKDVQFQPKGDSFVTLDEFFGIKNLSIIEETCGQAMITAGYTL